MLISRLYLIVSYLFSCSVYAGSSIDHLKAHRKLPNMSSTMSQQSGVTKFHRRNGKLQSCEPCRIRKLSCDHRVPTCGRCLKKNQPSECQYHPAPLTKLARPSSIPSTPIASRTSNSPVTIKARPGSVSVHASPYEQWVDRQSVPEDDSEKSAMPPPGFLGESSSSAVIAELNDSLGETQTEASRTQTDKDITDEQIHRGAAVLYHLQDLDSLLKCLEWWLSLGEGYTLFRPVYNIWVADLYRFFNTTLREVPQKQRLQYLSRLVWRNTSKPMHATGKTTVEEWALQASGENLRWETVGLFFSALGMNSYVLSSEDTTYRTVGSQGTRATIAKMMLRLANECLGMSQACGIHTDLYMCLLYERSPLVERIRGDLSAEAWTRFSEVCNTAVELGLHKEKRVDTHTPFFLCELRIRLFETIYAHDKYVSTYLGRPPRISYRHCVIQLPSDLSDDEICGDENVLIAALAKLQNGYATSGKITRATRRRASLIHYIIREDILEIVLGNPHEDVSSRVEQIRERIKLAVAEMPAFMNVNLEELLSTVRHGMTLQIPGRNVPWQPMDVLRALGFHCVLRHTDFLLERALYRRCKSDPSRLIASACSLLDLAMKTHTKATYLQDFQADIVEIVSCPDLVQKSQYTDLFAAGILRLAERCCAGNRAFQARPAGHS